MSALDDLFADFKVEVSIRIERRPEEVWDLITDVGRIGEFSPETVGAEWLDGASGPEVGARFQGKNKFAMFEWSRVCTVDESESPTRFGYKVGDRFDGSPTGRWSFELAADGEATIVVQRYVHDPKGRSGTRLHAERDEAQAREIVGRRKNLVEHGMRTTLAAMKQALERASES